MTRQRPHLQDFRHRRRELFTSHTTLIVNTCMNISQQDYLILVEVRIRLGK